MSAIVTLAAFAACDEYNTNVMSTAFRPANSMVSRFVHPVYVEYSSSGPRVWGPYSDLVTANREADGITLTSADDSLALIVYGTTVSDTLLTLDAFLHVDMERDFALYLNGVQLTSHSQPVLQVLTPPEATCFMVLGAKKDNVLTDLSTSTDVTLGAICNLGGGALYFTGTGNIQVTSHHSHGILSDGPMVCNYPVSSTVDALDADAIHTNGSELRLIKGTWRLDALYNYIDTQGAPVLLGEESKLYLSGELYNPDAPNEDPQHPEDNLDAAE